MNSQFKRRQVKILTADSSAKLESSINAFISSLSPEWIVDIKFNVGLSGSSTDELYSAMVIYETQQTE